MNINGCIIVWSVCLCSRVSCDTIGSTICLRLQSSNMTLLRNARGAALRGSMHVPAIFTDDWLSGFLLDELLRLRYEEKVLTRRRAPLVQTVVQTKACSLWFVRANRQQTHHVSGLPRHAKKQGKSSRLALCGEKEAARAGDALRVDEWIGQVLSSCESLPGDRLLCLDCATRGWQSFLFLAFE